MQIQQDVVGGQQCEAGAGGLRHDQAVKWVVPGEFGKVVDRLGVLCGDAERFQALPGQLVAEAGGYVSFPSMVLMVRSHTVAAETCTPGADAMA